MYNVNHLGYYNGGVPQKGRGAKRGKAIGNIGRLHHPDTHNFLEYAHQDTKQVTPEDQSHFQNWMLSDKADYKKTQGNYLMHYDKNFEFQRDRNFWLLFLLSIPLFQYLQAKWSIEQKRALRTKIQDEIEDMPGHYFNNRGGVLLKRQFAGFMKYYPDDGYQLAW
jgi:hypothetical protein